MSGSLDRYGPLGRCEIRDEVEKGIDPLKAVLSAYEVFRGIAARSLEGIAEKEVWWDNEDVVENLYQEACRLFEGLGDIRPDGMKVVRKLRERAEDIDGTGVYLSALLNSTGMDELVVKSFPALDVIGYRIGNGKLVAVGRKVKAYSVGSYGEGTVLSWGNCERIGKNARKGLQASFGTSWHVANGAGGGIALNCGYALSMAASAEGGFQANMGEVSQLGPMAEGGYQANFGKAKSMAYHSQGGLQLNFGVLSNYFGEHAENGSVQINFGKTQKIGHPKGNHGLALNAGTVTGKKRTVAVDCRADGELLCLGSRLGEKFREIDFMKGLKRPDRKAIERVKAFGFERFEQEASAMAKELEGYVRSKYDR